MRDWLGVVRYPDASAGWSCAVLHFARDQEAICALLFRVEAVVPYSRGDLLSRVHELGACDVEEYTDAGTLIQV